MRTQYDQLLTDIINSIEKDDIANCASVLASSLQQASVTADLMNLPVEFMDSTRLMEDYQRALADSSLKCVVSLAKAANDKRVSNAAFD